MSKRPPLYRDVLLDTGPLIAVYCQADQHHAACAEVLKQVAPPMLTTWPVLTEAAWILRDESTALARLFDPRGLFRLVPQDEAALERMRDIRQRYHALRPQLADLSLVQAAEQLGLATIFTVDRRDFTVYRVRGRKFKLLPEVV